MKTETKVSAPQKTEAKAVVKTEERKVMQIRPLVTEKAVMLIESQNVLTFKLELKATKGQIKKEIEELFGVKVDEVRTMSRDSKKYAYVKLKKEFPAIDVATKLGMI